MIAKMKTFGHKRPVRNGQGEIVEFKDSPAQAITHEALGPFFLRDKDHKLIVSLEAGDLICCRPSGTRRVQRITARDLYRYLLHLEANRLTLEKARDRKARKAQHLADLRMKRAEKRLVRRDA